MVAYGKILVLTLNEQEEKLTNKIISAIADYIQIEPMQAAPALSAQKRIIGTWLIHHGFGELVVFLILCLCPLALFRRPGVGRAHEAL